MIIGRVLHSSSVCPVKSAATIIVGFKSHLFNGLSHKLSIQRYGRKHYGHDYYVLLLQRPQTFPTFGGRIVFPGGIVSKADSSPQVWSNLKCDRLYQASMVPETYKKLRGLSCCSKTIDTLDPAISFRICALRELFEETGLLLVQNQNKLDGLSAHAILLESDQLQFWQNRVVQDQSTFSELYAQFGCCPPLHALHEWSSWISPPILKHRFDTMFYFVEIELVISHGLDHDNHQRWKSSETEKLYADAPPAFLQNQSQQGSDMFKSIAPPQAYELCRLVHFEKLDQLCKFSNERSRLGSRSWCPLPAKTTINDQICTFLFLPGDQRYNQILDYWKQTNSSPEFDLSWLSDTHRNRFMFGPKTSNSWFDCTVHELGHLLPINHSEFLSKFS